MSDIKKGGVKDCQKLQPIPITVKLLSVSIAVDVTFLTSLQQFGFGRVHPLVVATLDVARYRVGPRYMIDLWHRYFSQCHYREALGPPRGDLARARWKDAGGNDRDSHRTALRKTQSAGEPIYKELGASLQVYWCLSPAS